MRDHGETWTTKPHAARALDGSLQPLPLHARQVQASSPKEAKSQPPVAGMGGDGSQPDEGIPQFRGGKIREIVFRNPKIREI